jgi:transcriptional regulator with XRE-family HTH domain
MATRESAVDRARRLGRQDRIRVGADLRQARVGAGLSLAHVARAVGRSPSQVSRIERGLSSATSIGQLVAIGGAVGLDVRVRTYPGPDPVRDIAQQRLLERLRRRCHPSLRLRVEIPIGPTGDFRAWDGWIDRFAPDLGSELGDQISEPANLAVEAESRIADGQAFLRRLAIKMRDGRIGTVLVIVADTRANRSAVAAIRLVAGDMFPVDARAALAALAAGRHPGGSALVFL